MADSTIAQYLNEILKAVYGKDVRQAIYAAISQCYSDVTNPTLNYEALQEIIQKKIDDGELANLAIGDGTVTTEKLASKAVVTDKIEDKAITINKIGNDVWDYLQGNTRFSWKKVYTTNAYVSWYDLLSKSRPQYRLSIKPKYENELLILKMVGNAPPASDKAAIPIMALLIYGESISGVFIKGETNVSPNNLSGSQMTIESLKLLSFDTDGSILSGQAIGDSIGMGNDIYLMEIPITDDCFKHNKLTNVNVSASFTNLVNTVKHKPSDDTLTVFSVYGDNIGTSGQYTSKYLFGYCLDNYSVASLTESSELTSPDNVDPSKFRNMTLSGGNPTELSDGAFVFGLPTSGNANLAYGNEICYLEIPMNVESDLLIQTGGGLIGNYTDVSVEGM